MENGLSIILPVYNEELIIKNVIYDIVSNIRQYVNDFEVIIINDGSTDNTLELINSIKMSFPELKVISHERNRGYGSALKTGIKVSQKDRVFIMDSDGQFRINDFNIFWKNKQSYDFILGYRAARKDNIYRRCLGKLGNFTANIFLRESIKDINCGFKLFKLRDLKNITLISTGGCIYFEILRYLLKKNKFLQLPVNHYRRIAGNQTGGNFKVILKNILEGAQIVWPRQTEIF